MFGEPAFSMRFSPEADAFDTLQLSGDSGAITGGHSTALADWKGERSRRVPGDDSTGVTVGNEERSEPRTHESVRASGMLAPFESRSETAQLPVVQLTSYQ